MSDPTHCVSYRLRRAARLAAKAYDKALKPAGLRNTQFSLIAVLAIEGEQTIGELSGLLATDGTTLTRNLEPLVRSGWVENATPQDARIRIVRLTPAGDRKYQEALPLWQACQRRVLEGMGSAKWPSIEKELAVIEENCR